MEQTQTTELEAFKQYVVGRNLTGARLGAVLAMILVPSYSVINALYVLYRLR